MAATLRSVKSNVPAGLRPPESQSPYARPTQPEFPNHPLSTKTQSTFRRALRAAVRYLIAFGIGIGGTLAWQAHREVAKQTVADWAAHRGWSLSWLLDRTGAKSSPLAEPAIAVEPVGHPLIQSATPEQTVSVAAPKPGAPTAPSATSADPQQLEAIATGLAAIRGRIEEIAAGQEQMASDIAKLKAREQEIRQRISAAAPRPAPAAASKPLPLPPPPPSRQPMPLH